MDERADHGADMAETEIHVGVRVIHDGERDAAGTCRLDAVVVVVGVCVGAFHCTINLRSTACLCNHQIRKKSQSRKGLTLSDLRLRFSAFYSVGRSPLGDNTLASSAATTCIFSQSRR